MKNSKPGMVLLASRFHIREPLITEGSLSYDWDNPINNDPGAYSADIRTLYKDFLSNPLLLDDKTWLESYIKAVLNVCPGFSNNLVNMLVSGVKENDSIINKFIYETLDYVTNKYSSSHVNAVRAEGLSQWITILRTVESKPKVSKSTPVEIAELQNLVRQINTNRSSHASSILQNWLSKPGGIEDFVTTTKTIFG